LIDIDNFFNNDATMSSLVTNLSSSTSQEIVNWVMTADGCVHSADTMQLNSTVELRRRCVLGLTHFISNACKCRRHAYRMRCPRQKIDRKHFVDSCYR